MADPGTVFPVWHIALTAAIVCIASLVVLRWRFREFSAPEALLIALVAGFSVLAWRLAGNTGALNDDPIPPFSPNDMLSPVLTYVSLGLLAGWRPLAVSTRWPQARAVLTLLSLVVNVLAI